MESDACLNLCKGGHLDTEVTLAVVRIGGRRQRDSLLLLLSLTLPEFRLDSHSGALLALFLSGSRRYRRTFHPSTSSEFQ